jgi:hypothetical protein
VIVTFEFLSGVTAKDYSAVAKKHNLKPIELNLQKLEDMMGQLLHEFTSIMSSEKKSLDLSDTLSYKIIFFSLITLTSMTVIGMTEVFYLKKYFMRRKLI